MLSIVEFIVYASILNTCIACLIFPPLLSIVFMLMVVTILGALGVLAFYLASRVLLGVAYLLIWIATLPFTYFPVFLQTLGTKPSFSMKVRSLPKNDGRYAADEEDFRQRRGSLYRADVRARRASRKISQEIECRDTIGARTIKGGDKLWREDWQTTFGEMAAKAKKKADKAAQSEKGTWSDDEGVSFANGRVL